MAQLDPDRYLRLTPACTYGRDDGLFFDKTNSQLVAVFNDTVVARFNASAVTAGNVLCGDGTTVISAALSDDAAISAAGVLRLKNDVQYTIEIPSSSGIDTDALGGGLAGCENIDDIVQAEQPATYCKTLDASASTYYNLEDATADDHTQWALWPANTQDTDLMYMGAAVPFCELVFDMDTVQTYTADGTTWKYWDGSAWSALTLIMDSSDAADADGDRSFGQDGTLFFEPPADWTACEVDGVTAYWLQVTPDADKIAVVGITNGVRHYTARPLDQFVVPHDCEIHTVDIHDTAATVHTTADIIFLLMNFSTGLHGGELTFPTGKRNDSFSLATPLVCSEGDHLGVVIVQEDGVAEMGPFSLQLTATLV